MKKKGEKWDRYRRVKSREGRSSLACIPFLPAWEARPMRLDGWRVQFSSSLCSFKMRMRQKCLIRVLVQREFSWSRERHVCIPVRCWCDFLVALPIGCSRNRTPGIAHTHPRPPTLFPLHIFHPSLLAHTRVCRVRDFGDSAPLRIFFFFEEEEEKKELGRSLRGTAFRRAVNVDLRWPASLFLR